MAIAPATIQSVFDFQRLSDRTHTISAVEYEVWTCKVACDFIGVDYAQANDATITAGAAIAASLRDGKTATVISCCFASPGVFNLAATPTVDTLYGGGLPSTISAGVVTLPLTAEDLTTEMTNGVVLSTAVSARPSVFQVTFYKAVG